MKKIYTFLFIIFTFSVSYSQVGNSPYPVIFVHGLNSDDQTWSSILTKLSSAWNLSTNHTIYAVLNARGGDTTDYLQDVIIPYKDVTGNIVNMVTLSSIYTINFKNFWNRNSADPRIILNSNTIPGSNQSPSNQSAIYKQGYALRSLIDSVLRVTGAPKVILLGHSMGGLAIREYLQRKENGINKWWVDPNDIVSGHKVAKVITIGTPHLGTDVAFPFAGIDVKSEAIRDMKNSYTGSSDAAFLFGNFEPNVPSSFYNQDINCNGFVTDTITGLDSNTVDNSIIPLPQNILYTWIMSNYLGLGTDLAVPLSSQALYDTAFVPAGLADTIMTNKNHIQETGDTRTLIRGLDEPDNKEFAYNISLNKLYAGYITLQSNSVTSDSDYYKVQTSSAGNLKINLNSLNSGVTIISLLSGLGNILVTKNITTSNDSISFYTSSGNYFIRIAGNSNQNPNLNSYSFTASFIPALELNITLSIEGMWNDPAHVQDTVRLFLRSSISPYNKVDSAIAYLNLFGNAVVNFASAPSGNYFLQLVHRNALETWSSSAVTFTSGMTTNYDFTASQSTAFGNNLILKSGRWCIYSGDVDRNESINLTDMIEIHNDATNFEIGYLRTDLTGDNAVNLTDMVIGFNNSTNFITVIKP